MPGWSSTTRRWIAGCVIGLAALALAACGSSGSASSSTVSGTNSVAASSSSATKSSVDVAALKAKVLARTKVTHIGPTTPIGKPIPKGKHLIWVNCGAPSCIIQGQAFTAAAKVLGWTVTTLNAEPTPESVQAAFQTAIRDHPDGVASAAFGQSLYPHQLAALNAMHIPVMSATGQQETGQDGITYDPIGPKEAANIQKLLADKALADTGGGGLIGSVLLGGYPIVKVYTAGWTNEIAAQCPSCKQVQLQIEPKDLATDAPTLITNFLRANPGMKALFLSYGLEFEGLTAAAKGAGISLPKIYSWAPDPPDIAALQSGQWAAATVAPYTEIGWQLIDAFARTFTGESIDPDKSFPQAGVVWSNDYHNVPTKATPFPAVVPNYQAQYEALWGVK